MANIKHIVLHSLTVRDSKLLAQDHEFVPANMLI